eukprot:4838385-Prymnesium_polylepis.2
MRCVTLTTASIIRARNISALPWRIDALQRVEDAIVSKAVDLRGCTLALLQIGRDRHRNIGVREVGDGGGEAVCHARTTW